MTTVLDFYGPQPAPFYRCIKAGGAAGIARYLTNSPTDPRQITPAEVAAAHAAGLAVHFFYEMAPIDGAYFTYPQGIVDCRMAIARLKELGAPARTVVYFAVDVDLDPNLTVAYFNAIEAVQDPSITPGVYGYQAMVGFARTRFPYIGQHLAQTYGSVDGSIDLWQRLQEDRCGVTVDVNDCYVDGWKGDDMGITGDQAKDIVREMLRSDEGAILVEGAIVHPGGYGQALEVELQALRTQAAAAGTPIDEKKILADATANLIAKLSA